jgi:hypothetical protein
MFHPAIESRESVRKSKGSGCNTSRQAESGREKFWMNTSSRNVAME